MVQGGARRVRIGRRMRRRPCAYKLNSLLPTVFYNDVANSELTARFAAEAHLVLIRRRRRRIYTFIIGTRECFHIGKPLNSHKNPL